jgi:hypothetical protein
MTKKSFILHIDSLGILDELSDEQAGQLFKLIANFHNPNKPKITEITQMVNLAFYPFKMQFQRDLQQYESIVERNKNNGSKGGRPKKVNPNKPKKADSDSKNGIDSDTDSKNDIEIMFENFWNYYKKGSKKIAKEKFIKLNDEDLERIKKHLPLYFKANPEIKFRKDAERYLSNRLWENNDEDLLLKLSNPINNPSIFVDTFKPHR